MPVPPAIYTQPYTQTVPSHLDIPHTVDPQPDAGKDQMRAALGDFAEFTSSMKQKVVQGRLMDFETKSMFMLVEQQIEVMRCVSVSASAGGLS